MDHLDRLDAVLIRARRWPSRPGHRALLWSKIDVPVDLTTLRVLRAVERHEKDPTVGDVANDLGVAASTASRFVDRVVERGELQRRACADDGRRTRLALTTSGRTTLAAVTEARRAVLAEVTRDWDDAEIGLLADLLERLGDRYDTLETQS